MITGNPTDLSELDNALMDINWFKHSHTRYTDINDEEFRRRLQEMRNTSERALVMSGGVKLLETGFFLRRMDNLLM
ncbi:MAG TPA: hypothetical protein DEQ09_01860, partial [Bacteroidales bacterium]|nr:hypothetical protein [Bacteroidales bacterium]